MTKSSAHHLPPDNRQFIDIANARVDEQRAVMHDIAAQEHCPFCLENLQKYHKQPILKEGAHWIVTTNQWPYENTKLHLMAISKVHAERLSELPVGAGDELVRLFAELEREYQIPGGGFAMRFGDSDHSAATVLHLHAQFIFPDIEKPDFLPVRFKIGKEWEKR